MKTNRLFEQLRGISLLFSKMSFLIANRRDDTKIEWLRKQECAIGDKTRFVGNCSVVGAEPYLVEIGEDRLIIDHVDFFTHDESVSVLNSFGYFDKPNDKMARIKVGNNCFIGSRSTIMMG